MSFACGPVYIWWQNLADEEAHQRLHDDLDDAMTAIVGEERAPQARNAVRSLLRGKLGSLWRYGRAWLRLYRSASARINDKDEALLRLGVQWSLLRRQHSLGGSIFLDCGEGEITASLRVPRAGVYLTVELPPALSKRLGYRDEREIGVSLHNGALWFKLWNDPHECSSRAPWTDPRSRLRQPVLHFDDLLFGKVRHRKEDLEYFTGTLNLDDGYAITARRFVSEWKRPRWPVPRRVMRVELTIPAGIPVPGKGENSYDCEDDAIYGLTTAAASIEEAARTLVADVQQTRRTRGGRDWQPKP